ncbi:ABC transporter permease [Natronosporangium hydrolyticum]|uniref:ABC transporter permease n=1 Tax=Natronosporangium hydrolyticum TaxID=2811111 RepID=A0A895YC66_9ACTN|nr:ABC transporter permease [Natronosporangium hydrolyticum]QSB13802.1 ABC transporter permease [Natronosporangium hydrolyticum]
MRLLTLTPWRRGPLLLLRRPGVAVALFAAAMVAALPAAAAPIFLSSAEHATLHRQIDQTCPGFVGVQVTGELAPVGQQGSLDAVLGEDRFRGREAAVAAHAPAGFDPPVNTGYGEVDVELTDRPLPNPDLSGLLLLARDDFADHIEVVDGAASPAEQDGLWLPDEYAEAQQIQIGDELELAARGADLGSWHTYEQDEQGLLPLPEVGSVTLPVAGIYRDLRASPDPPYWCGVAQVYRGSEDPFDDNLPPPAAMVTPETLLAVGDATQLRAGQQLELTLTDPDLTSPAAAEVAEGAAALQATLYSEYRDLFPNTFLDEVTFSSRLDRFQQRAELVRSGIVPPVLPITAAGTLVGLAVTGAAAFYWAQRRRRELAVLAAHGVSASAIGAKAVFEALPALLLGTVTGWLTAWGLVASVGPSPVLAQGTLATAALAAGVTGTIGVLLVGLLAAGRARGLVDTPPASRRVGWWRKLPWELTLFGGAAASWFIFADDQVSDTVVGGVGSVAHIPAGLLLTPILIIIAITILGARIAAALLRRPGPDRPARGTARYLAWRRISRAAVATTVLAAATAMPVAMAAFGATATGTIHTTAEAKLQFNLGSDTVISYLRPIDRERDEQPPPPPIPDQLAGQSTEVLRLNQQRLDGLTVDLLAVDLTSFTDGAFWDPRISGPDLATAVDQLADGGTMTVVANRRFEPGPATLEVRGEPIEVAVAATRPLPGAQAAYPLVIVDRDRLAAKLDESYLDLFTPQIWIAGEPAETLATASAAGLPLTYSSSIEEHRAGAVYEPVTYTFQYLTALSIFTGLIAAIGLLLYLEARTAAHRRAYVLLRRLGLGPGQHRRAMLLEIGAPVATGLLVGVAAAVTLAYTLRSGFDIHPTRFPGTLLVLPVTATGVITATAIVIAVLAAVLTHHRIHHTNPAEVLRDTP